MDRIAYLVAVIAAGCALSAGVHAQEVVLADNGKSDFKIVVADDASASTKYAAEELQRWLKEMTSAELPIVSDKTTATA